MDKERGNGTLEGAADGVVLNSSEATQYDRQIRLWGLEAQKRIRTSKVLVFGALGLSVEVCKNLVLAGVHTLCLSDAASVSAADLGAQFFLTTEDIGKRRDEVTVPRLQALNPNVSIYAHSEGEHGENFSNVSVDFLRTFSIVIATNISLSQGVGLDAKCREAGVKYFQGDVFGFYGYFFEDLGDHHFILEQKSDVVEEETKTVKKVLPYPSLEASLSYTLEGVRKRKVPHVLIAMRVLEKLPLGHSGALDEVEAVVDSVLAELKVKKDHFSMDTLASVIQSASSELCSTAAIVGGLLGSEVIKVISGKEEPYFNVFTFDGFTSKGTVHALGVKHEEDEAEWGKGRDIIEL